MDFIVVVKAWNGTFYLTENLDFRDALGDEVLWDGAMWTEQTIENYIKEDAKEHEYNYFIEKLGG